MAGLFPAVQSFLRGQATLKEVEEVLDEGADPNQWTGPSTPLKCAIQAHHKHLLRLLLDKKATVDVKDSRGVSPLHVAVFEGKTDCIQILLDTGADANILDQFGQSPLFFAPTRVVCEQLIAGRADVNLRNSKNQSPVHLAAHAGLDDTVSYLAALAGDKAVNGQDQHGHTPLYYAAHSRVKSTIHVLKRMGAERPHRSRLRGAAHCRVEAVAEAADPAALAQGPAGAEGAAATESAAPRGADAPSPAEASLGRPGPAEAAAEAAPAGAAEGLGGEAAAAAAESGAGPGEAAADATLAVASPGEQDAVEGPVAPAETLQEDTAAATETGDAAAQLGAATAPADDDAVASPGQQEPAEVAGEAAHGVLVAAAAAAAGTSLVVAAADAETSHVVAPPESSGSPPVAPESSVSPPVAPESIAPERSVSPAEATQGGASAPPPDAEPAPAERAGAACDELATAAASTAQESTDPAAAGAVQSATAASDAPAGAEEEQRPEEAPGEEAPNQAVEMPPAESVAGAEHPAATKEPASGAGVEGRRDEAEVAGESGHIELAAEADSTSPPMEAAPPGTEAASGAALKGQEDSPDAPGQAATGELLSPDIAAGSASASGAPSAEAEGAEDHATAASADGTVGGAVDGEGDRGMDPPQVVIAEVTTQVMDHNASCFSKHSFTEACSECTNPVPDTDAGTVLSAAGEEQMPLEGLLPTNDELEELVPDFKVGDVIIVVRSLMADNEDPLHLEQSQRGIVEVIDEEGDALIDFEDHDVPQWVCAAHFGHLSLAAASALASSQQLDFRVPTPADTLVAGWSQQDADLFGEACGGVMDLAATQIQRRFRGVMARRQTSALQAATRMRLLLMQATRSGTLSTALAAAKAKIEEQRRNAPAEQPEKQPDGPRPGAAEILAEGEEPRDESKAGGEPQPQPEAGGGPPLDAVQGAPAAWSLGRDRLLAALEGTWFLFQGEPGSVLAVDARGGYTLTNRKKEWTAGSFEAFEVAKLQLQEQEQEFWQLRRTDARSGTAVECFGQVRGTELWLSDAGDGWEVAAATPSLYACGKLGTTAAVAERSHVCEAMAGNYSGWQGEPDSLLVLDPDGNYSVRGGRSHSVGVVEIFGKADLPAAEGAWWQLRLTCSIHWEDGARAPSEEGRSLYLLGRVKSDDDVLWLTDSSMSKDEGWEHTGTLGQRKIFACKRVPAAVKGSEGVRGTEKPPARAREAGEREAGGEASGSVAQYATEEPSTSTGGGDATRGPQPPGQAEERPPPLLVGGQAWIFGFTDPKREKLNGMECTLQEYLTEEDRWILVLSDSPKKMKVKPTHLRSSPLPGHPPAASSESSKAASDQKASSDQKAAGSQQPATGSSRAAAPGALNPDRLPEPSKSLTSFRSHDSGSPHKREDSGCTQSPHKREEKKSCIYWEVRLDKGAPDDKFGFVQANGKLEFETRLAALSPRAGEQRQQAASSPLPGPDCLIVRRIHEGGLMQVWNGEHLDAAVQPQDRILSVNGHRTVEEMQRQIRERSVLMQLVRYPEHFSVYLRKDSSRLGFRYERPVNAPAGAAAEGLRITEVMLEGALPEHNEQQVEMGNWHNVVLPDMRITAVNDVSGDVLEIAAELKRSDHVTLHLRRAEQDLAVKQQMRARMNMLTGGISSPHSTSRTPRAD